MKVTGCYPSFLLASLSLFCSPWSLVRSSLEIWWNPRETVSCQEDRERAALVVTEGIILLGSVVPHQPGHDRHQSCQRAPLWVAGLASEQGCLCSCSQPDPTAYLLWTQSHNNWCITDCLLLFSLSFFFFFLLSFSSSLLQIFIALSMGGEQMNYRFLEKTKTHTVSEKQGFSP